VKSIGSNYQILSLHSGGSTITLREINRGIASTAVSPRQYASPVRYHRSSPHMNVLINNRSIMVDSSEHDSPRQLRPVAGTRTSSEL
jgi:predicted alternative tryptophan synthase beta-subunit